MCKEGDWLSRGRSTASPSRNPACRRPEKACGGPRYYPSGRPRKSVLEALTEVPEAGAPAQALLATTVDRARGALSSWYDWEQSHLSKG